MLTRMKLRRAEGPQTAITDVYDERRGTFLVRYPVWLILGLGLAGVLAFAVTGFMAAAGSANAPVVMYVWLCALVIALQSSIFRNRLMRARLIATLTVTVVSVVAVAFLAFRFLPDIIAHFTTGGTSGPNGSTGSSLANSLASNPWTYSAINFGLLAIFWIDTIRRWVRRALGLSPTSSVALTPDEERANEAHPLKDVPRLEELVSGDLIAGAVLTLALSFVLDAAILGNFVHAVANNPCTVSLPVPLGKCTPQTAIGTTSTLTFIDRIQALIYFPLGLIILALTAVLSGLGAAGGVDTPSTRHAAVERAGATGTSSQAIAEDVTTTVLKTLRSAVDRRIRYLFRNLALSLRTVAWPALVFAAIFGVSQFSVDLAGYLAADKAPQNALNTLKIMGPGLAWGLGAALGIAFAAALFVFRWRVADNTLRFMGLIGFVLLLTFWLFSMALAGFNLLLEQIGLADGAKTQPFLPLGLTTYVSLAALILWGGITLLRRSRASAQGTGAELANANVGGGLDAQSRVGEPDR